MSKDEVKKIFFELLTEDEEFQRKLTEFILNAVAKKFVECVATEKKPSQVEVAEPEPEEKNSTAEFAENVAKLIEERDGQIKTLNEEKISVESERDNLQTKLSNVESERDNLQTKLSNVEGERDNLQTKLSSVEGERDNLQTKLSSVEGERDNLQTKLSNVESERDNLQTKLSNVESERDNLQTKLSSVEGERDNLQTKLSSVEDERDNLQTKLSSVEGERDNLQTKLSSVEGERDNLQTKLSNVEGERDNLQTKLSSVEGERDNLKHQLDERFSEGWEVYQKFLRIDSATRKESGIYSEDFVSFICSGAQMKRLESIWEAALDCKRNGNFNDAEIFFEVFKYCVRLVNAAQGDKVIELLNTQLGDRYDTDKHSTGGTNSAAQGVVREIILVGYRNNISKKTIKKSNVRVG